MLRRIYSRSNFMILFFKFKYQCTRKYKAVFCLLILIFKGGIYYRQRIICASFRWKFTVARRVIEKCSHEKPKLVLQKNAHDGSRKTSIEMFKEISIVTKYFISHHIIALFSPTTERHRLMFSPWTDGI